MPLRTSAVHLLAPSVGESGQLRSRTPSPTPRRPSTSSSDEGEAKARPPCSKSSLLRRHRSLALPLVLLLSLALLLTAASATRAEMNAVPLKLKAWAAAAALALPLVASQAQAYKLNPTSPIEEDTTDVFGGKGAKILRHSADWSRDVQPIAVHSHNDYWRDTPVLDALAHGARSIESDVWLHPTDGELYVGHDPYSLSRTRTFETLTLAPLEKAIAQANFANAQLSSNSESSFFAALQQDVAKPGDRNWNGYYTAGVGNGAPLQLMVDLKTAGEPALEATSRALEKLKAKGYLTTYSHGVVTKGPITVIGTGNTPAATLAAQTERHIFLDCPLGAMGPDAHIELADGARAEYNATLCGVASTYLGYLTKDWKGLQEPTEAQLANLTRAFDESHARGIPTRVWDTPAWPNYARDRVNEVLLRLGSDWINADDLDAIKKW